MSKQVMLRVPEETYEKLDKICKTSLRPMATEIMFRLNGTLGDSVSEVVRTEEKVVRTELPEALKVESEYQEVIDRIDGSLDRDLDYDEAKEIKSLVEGSGLRWNAYKKTLEKVEGSGFKVIHQF